MSNNERITVTPEIPALFLTSLELEILDCYGYEYEDDGYGNYKFTSDDGAATLKVSVEDLLNSENECVVKLHKLVKNMSIKPENGRYFIHLCNISVDLFSAEIVFQCLLKKPNAKALLGDEILLKSHDVIARITTTSIQQASLSSILFQWRNPSPLHAAIIVEGGLIQSVLLDPSNAIEVLVIDYDTEGHDERDLVKVKQSDGSFSSARVTDFSVEEPLIGLGSLYNLISKGDSHE